MAQVKIYVREYYAFTQWHKQINAEATGAPGQEAVTAQQGTLAWIPNDRRIVIADVAKSLQRQMAAGFEQWDPQRDMARHYHRGRIPMSVTTMLRRQGYQIGFH